mgnify:CR=1 FL=1
MSSDVYKERLTTIRNQQKQMIKQDIAASGNTDWTVNNNKAKGRKMVNDMKKLLLRAFNNDFRTENRKKRRTNSKIRNHHECIY